MATNKRIRKKEFSLKNQYQESFDFIRESRKFIYVVIAIFLLFTIFGFALPVPDVISKAIIEFIQNLIKETSDLSGFEMIKFIFSNNIQSSFFGMILGIFLGIFPIILAAINGYVLGFVLSMSVMSEGISVLWRLLPHGIFELPAIFISLGLGIAFYVNFLKNIHKTYIKNILPNFLLFFILCLILFPFTIIIIPFIFLFLLIYDYVIYYDKKKKYLFLIASIAIFPIMVFNIIFNKKLRTIWNKDFSDSLKVFLLIILPLLIIAAIIEGSLIAVFG